MGKSSCGMTMSNCGSSVCRWKECKMQSEKCKVQNAAIAKVLDAVDAGRFGASTRKFIERKVLDAVDALDAGLRVCCQRQGDRL